MTYLDDLAPLDRSPLLDLLHLLAFFGFFLLCSVLSGSAGLFRGRRWGALGGGRGRGRRDGGTRRGLAHFGTGG